MPDSTHSHLNQLLLLWLVHTRKKQGLTQQDLAKKLHRPQSYVSKYEQGERRLDVVELIDIVAILGLSASRLLTLLQRGISPDNADVKESSILDRWGLSENALSALVDENPSMRGIMFGYVAEHKLIELCFTGQRIRYISKHDDHDRGNKGDHVIQYRGHQFIVESKSLQTNSIRSVDGVWCGKAQVDASDRRTIELPGGEKVLTTLLRYGEFDLLAVNCFAFDGHWKFAFARNEDLPCSKYRKYPEVVAKQLIASLVSVSWPPEPPFFDNPFEPLDRMIKERSR